MLSYRRSTRLYIQVTELTCWGYSNPKGCMYRRKSSLAELIGFLKLEVWEVFEPPIPSASSTSAVLLSDRNHAGSFWYNNPAICLGYLNPVSLRVRDWLRNNDLPLERPSQYWGFLPYLCPSSTWEGGWGRAFWRAGMMPPLYWRAGMMPHSYWRVGMMPPLYFCRSSNVMFLDLFKTYCPLKTKQRSSMTKRRCHAAHKLAWQRRYHAWHTTSLTTWCHAWHKTRGAGVMHDIKIVWQRRYHAWHKTSLTMPVSCMTQKLVLQHGVMHDINLIRQHGVLHDMKLVLQHGVMHNRKLALQRGVMHDIKPGVLVSCMT